MRLALPGLLLALTPASPAPAGDWHQAYESLTRSEVSVTTPAGVSDRVDVEIQLPPRHRYLAAPRKATPPRPTPPRPLDPGKVRYQVEKEKIYWGQHDSFRSPAVIEAEEVYLQIPAYQRIRQHNLEKDDPEYWPLMRKAARSFVIALKKACKATRHDLVGEVGSIRAEGVTIPDITAQVIAALSPGKGKKSD